MAPTEDDTRGVWTSWLSFQCMPLPFGGHRPSTLPPTSAPRNTQEDARREKTGDEAKASKTGGKNGADNKSLVYEEPLQHPRPTTAPEMTSRHPDFPERDQEDSDSVTSTTRIVIIPHPPAPESSKKATTKPKSKTDNDIHRRTISAPMEFRHLSSGAHLVQASSDELRRHLASKALKFNLEAAEAAEADKKAAGFRRLRRQRSLPTLNFMGSPITRSRHDMPAPQIKALPAESTPLADSFENSITCGIVRSRSVPSVKRPRTAEATNNAASSRPSTSSSGKSTASDESDFPPPPLPLILLPNPEEGESATGSFSGKGGNRTKPPPNVLTTNPVPLKPKDGFYQAVSLGNLFDYGSSYSLDSSTTWNTDDLYGVPPTLSPTNKVVMRRVQHGVPQIMSVEGIHGLSPPVRNRYSIQAEK